jgi:hypothetical protein
MSLERELLALRVEWPETPDLTAVVSARLAEPPPRRRFAWRPVLAYGLSALLVGFAVLMAASPDTRSAVLEFLGLESVKIERREPTATPRPAGRLGSDLGLGESVPLARARGEVDFPILVPAALGEPDAVYLTAFPTVGEAVHLVYGPDRALLLVGQFPATVEPLIEKTVGAAAELVRLRIDGHRAYFLRGAHGFAFSRRDGRSGYFEEQRLAGNTLLVERGDVLVRIEGELDQARAVEIFRSLE